MRFSRSVLLGVALLLATPLANSQDHPTRDFEARINPFKTLADSNVRVFASPPRAADQACGTMTLWGAQLAVGVQPTGEWITRLMFVNRSPNRSAMTAEFFTSAGTAFQVTDSSPAGGTFEETELSASLAPYGVAFNVLSYCKDNTYGLCASNAVKNGMIRFTTTSSWSATLGSCQPDIEVALGFQLVQTNGLKPTVDVPVTTGATSYVMPALSTPDTGVALAISNGQAGSNNVTVSVFGDNGQQIATTQFVFGPQPGKPTQQQLAIMLDDVFVGNSQWQAFMSTWKSLSQGSVTITGTAPLAAIGILVDRSSNASASGNFMMSRLAIWPQ